jgi:Domain of unknown function (DUF5615)
LKLLLDEHFSKRVAEEMRRRGYDVAAVTEREDLRGLSDAVLFAQARTDGSVIVTQDYADFAALMREAAIDEIDHPGVLFVPKRLWASVRDFDRLASALARFLDEHPRDDGLPGGGAWLV